MCQTQTLLESSVLTFELRNLLIKELDLLILKTLCFFCWEFRLGIGCFLEDEALVAFGIQGNFDMSVFKDGILG